MQYNAMHYNAMPCTKIQYN